MRRLPTPWFDYRGVVGVLAGVLWLTWGEARADACPESPESSAESAEYVCSGVHDHEVELRNRNGGVSATTTSDFFVETASGNGVKIIA